MIEEADLPATIQETTDLVAFIMEEVADIKKQIEVQKSRALAGKNVDQDWMARAHAAIAHRQKDIIRLNAHKKKLIHQECQARAQKKRDDRAKQHADRIAVAKEREAQANRRHAEALQQQAAARAEKTRRMELAQTEDKLAITALKEWLKTDHPDLWPRAVEVLQGARNGAR